MTQKSPTLEELMAKLRANPEWAVREQERDRIYTSRVTQHDTEQAPIVTDLRKSGLNITRLSDMMPMTAPYPQALPILLEHLQKPYSDGTRELIARILAVPDARDAWPILVSEYCKAPTVEERSTVKDGLACALAAAATDDVIDELIRLVKDRSHGRTRILLLEPIRKSKLDAAKRIIEELACDPDLEKEINSWNKRRK